MTFKKTKTTMATYGITVYGYSIDDDYCRLVIYIGKTGYSKEFQSKLLKKLSISKTKNIECNFEIVGLQYSIKAFDGFLSIDYGVSEGDSSIDDHFGWFIPWLNDEFRRHTIYNLDSSIYREESGHIKYKKRQTLGYDRISDGCEKCYFLFKDFDSAEIVATCYIEEREWSHGTGWFKWLRYFSKSTIQRSLVMSFSEEVGSRKGSWKGGTIGTGASMLKTDLSVDAFKRYCDGNKLTFIEEITKSDAQNMQNIKKLEAI